MTYEGLFEETKLHDKIKTLEATDQRQEQLY
jgi:hypothetical protein